MLFLPGCSVIFAPATAGKLGRLSQLAPVAGNSLALTVELDFASTIIANDILELTGSSGISGRIDGQPVKAGNVTVQVTYILSRLHTLQQMW